MLLFLVLRLTFSKAYEADAIGKSSFSAKQEFAYLAGSNDVKKEFETWSMERFADVSKSLTVQAGGITVTATMGADQNTEAVIKLY